MRTLEVSTTISDTVFKKIPCVILNGVCPNITHLLLPSLSSWVHMQKFFSLQLVSVSFLRCKLLWSQFSQNPVKTSLWCSIPSQQKTWNISPLEILSQTATPSTKMYLVQSILSLFSLSLVPCPPPLFSPPR